ncbi:MAG: penicillin-binding protein 1C [Treponema sp.]|nr:penicillin-binding protein 1C [Treponema sp.]
MNIYGNIYDGVDFSVSYEDRNGNLLQIFLTENDQYRIYKPLSAYPKDFIEALLMQEDKYFYSHFGVNPVAVIKAGWETYVKKSRRMGASTITMQTAKLKYGIYTKSIFGKLKQIRKALYLELCFSKDEILEAYLNLAPCGYNVEGFATASWYYFGKDISKLNLSENIMLCVLPQNPTKRSPNPKNTPSELIAARKVLFSSWVEKHPEDADKEIYMDMQLSVECNFHNEARHFTEMLLYEDKITGKETIKTTLNLPLQKKCEDIFDSYLNRNRNFGVRNAAILLVDWKKMEVVANIGAANYYDNDIQGKVNATISKRSPGSTLKPFIYAMALEQGLIHYRTMLKDIPTTFNEYSPDNYGSIFKGPVQAWFALGDSRNIPAIYLEQNLKERNLYDYMTSAGITGLKDRDHYGLSIVLGTADVTMMELAKLYCTIPNGGMQKEIRTIMQSAPKKEKRMLTPESAYIVRKMLEENVPPYQNKPLEIKDIPVAYKTGTSIGFKDAWSAGIFDRYVLIVWVGNFDGEGNNAFLGRQMAAPLFFNIAYSILSSTPKNELLPEPKMPEGVSEIEVCAISGGLPTECCEHTEKAYFIPGVSPIEKCKIHRKINIDTRTGYRTDETDKPYIKTAIREFWPSDLMALFEEAGLPRLPPPTYPPEDQRIDTGVRGYPPQITSLLGGTDYIYRPKDPKKNKVLLYAASDAESTELLWFDGSNFIGRAKPSQIIEWAITPGIHEITVTDQMGRADSITISVKETEY